MNIRNIFEVVEELSTYIQNNPKCQQMSQIELLGLFLSYFVFLATEDEKISETCFRGLLETSMEKFVASRKEKEAANGS